MTAGTVRNSNKHARTPRADGKDIILTKGHLLTYTGSRSLPRLQRQKKSTDRPDTHSHLLIMTAALTDVSAKIQNLR
ncbi:hypothetical protein PAMP_012537 [Pampus punctatissimus]